MGIAPIALLTDFGYDDAYAGILKGVIRKISARTEIIDLAHGIEPQGILQGALTLEDAHRFFPEGTIFVCVVDPGVGTHRKILCAKTKSYFFIGPDNGLLSLALEHEKKIEVREVSNKKYFIIDRPSQTFHGRDVMSPAAAYLSRAKNKIQLFRSLGPEIGRIKRAEIPRIIKSETTREGKILFFDRFGNGITNLKRSDASRHFWSNARVIVSGNKIGSLRSTYQDGAPGLLALFNSFDRLEIAVSSGSARQAASLKKGDDVQVICLT